MSAVLVVILALQLAAPSPQSPQSDPRDRRLIADFQGRVRAYAALRDRLARGMPRPTDATQTAEYERQLRQKITAARRGAKVGDFFSTEIQEVFKRLLTTSSADIMALQFADDDAEPEESQTSQPPEVEVNERYPEGAPRPRVPVAVLLRLPSLPPDVQYRFIGRDLLLHDVRGDVVLDVMRNAAQ